MAEVLASLKKIGGNGEQYTETSLWTNPDPTTTFNAQAVTLSESLSNYKYIGINFAYSTAYGTGDCESTILLSVEDFRKGGYNTGVRRNTASMVMVNTSNTARDRAVYYVNDTSVRFGTCYQVASTSSDNTCVIPLEILGINELAYRPDDYIVQSGTYSIASTNTPVTVTVGFKPKKLTTWRIGGTTTFESFTYDDRISDTTYDRLMAFSGGINGATRTIGQSQTNELVSINNDGFTVATGGVTGTWNYIAVGVKE